MNAWTVLGRMRGILISSGATCVAVVFLRQALEGRGIPVEPRLVLSVIAGGIAYGSCMALVANGVARDVLRMIRSLGPALRPPGPDARQAREPTPESCERRPGLPSAELPGDEAPGPRGQPQASVVPQLLREGPEHGDLTIPRTRPHGEVEEKVAPVGLPGDPRQASRSDSPPGRPRRGTPLGLVEHVGERADDRHEPMGLNEPSEDDDASS